MPVVELSKSKARIVFLTRDPVVHQHTGSSTYALSLLQLLRMHGARVTLVATTAYGRSPRLFFSQKVAAPGVELRFPGYLRVGQWYVCLWRPRAWARLVVRLAARHSWLRGVERAVERVFGGSLYGGAWDLTQPTEAECEVARAAMGEERPTAVVANYCFWGSALPALVPDDVRSAILMHDLLSARERRLREAGLPLDAPPLDEAEEMRWLGGADTVLAAQSAEAERIAPLISAQVVVTPVLLNPCPSREEQIVAGRCLFVGSNIGPNRSGLQFLLDEVWPRVRRSWPEATLAVAGSVGALLSERGDANALAELGVERLGSVPSVEPEYARAAVCLVPLRVGTGIKVKLLEALEHGKAIVSTRVGVEGLGSWIEEAVLVADDPELFAAGIVALLSDGVLRRQQQAAALRAAEEQFGPLRPLEPAFLEALLGTAPGWGARPGEGRVTGAEYSTAAG